MGRLFRIYRNVAWGQWANCLLFLHVGSVCLVFWCPFTPRPGKRWYGTGLALFTPERRFFFRLGGYCDERRKRRALRHG